MFIVYRSPFGLGGQMNRLVATQSVEFMHVRAHNAMPTCM